MEVFDKVCKILSELCGAESISPEQELQKDLGLDSLQMVTLLVLLEGSFDITLNEVDMNPFDLVCVQHVVNLIEKYLDGDKNEKED